MGLILARIGLNMILFKHANDLVLYLDKQRKSGLTIGFVPTMGALHEGHLSLVKQALATADIAVVSIFVNPTQFNDPADFEKYPVSTGQDIQLLEQAGTPILFLPAVSEIYPQGTDRINNYDIGRLETLLEGSFRPGHFQGVCQVVERLLRIVEPDVLVMGQKDYQQCMVISRLLQLMGWQERTRLLLGPTLREADGLAMSSRNRRLNPEERRQSTAIYELLSGINKDIRPGNLQALKQHSSAWLVNKGFRVDYVEIASAADLSPVEDWDGKTPLVALVAAFLNQVRLIDNMLLDKTIR
jgi:pantoate--beta-alanine ligase